MQKIETSDSSHRLPRKSTMLRIAALATLAVAVPVAAHAGSGTGLAGMANTVSQQSQSGTADVKHVLYLIGAVGFVLGIINIRKDDPREKAKGGKEIFVSALALGASLFSKKIAQTMGLTGSNASSTL